MNDELGIFFLQALEKMVEEVGRKRLVFFVAGRTGWGKSSTVNSLVGKVVSKVSDYEPETADVTGFEFEMNGVKAIIFDTPGLRDGKGNDETYIELMRSKVEKPDSMLYVSRLDETRQEDDRQVIKIISAALGERVWEYTVIVFTFANNVKPSQYQTKLDAKTKIIRELIADHISDKEVADQIPVVAIDNDSDTTPDGKKWLGYFVTALVEKVSKEGTIALLYMLTDSVRKGRIILNRKQKAIIRRKFVNAVLQSAGTLMGIGITVAGLINAPIIVGFAGGGIVGTLIGAWLSRYDDRDDDE
ncbi:GTPase [Microcoleus sp. OTE_8_concoct_300]|uniref:GTPase n=1 Tax=Microcoleus sp. OTE_8_concoct_300 TaxID=2964710 RepID=UPI00403F1308